MGNMGKQFRFHNAVNSMNYVAIYNNVHQMLLYFRIHCKNFTYK